MAANPYEDQFEYGPDGLPIKKLPSTAPSMAPQERTLPSLGNPIPAQPSVGLASPALAVSTQPPRTLESLAPTNSFNNSSVPNFATARGGYVGARTDAEAARNMQSRMEQDQAAQYMVQSMNRGATAMNDLRATKLGISSGTLAAMEGRPGGEWASSGPLLSVGKEGVNFGDEASRQSQIDGLLSRAASQTGFGGSKRSAAMLAAAQGMMAPQMAQQELEYGLAGKQMDLQSDQAKSLMDLVQRREITPFQQAQLNQDQQKLGLQQQQLDSMSGIKRQAMVTQGLDNVQTNIYNSPEWKNYITMKGQRDITNGLAQENTPAAAHSLATAVAKSSDPSTGVLSGEVEAIKSGSGNIPQRIGGWINQNVLGGSAFLPSVRADLAKNVGIRADEFRDMAMERVHNLIPELQQRGIALETVLQGDQLKDYQIWLGKQRQGQGAQQATPQYRYDPEKGLVPY